MSNKHEPHEQFVLGLLSRGISYRQIAQDLTAMGCKTDAPAVYRWLKSRAAKIASRASLINPLAAAGNPQMSPPASVLHTASFTPVSASTPKCSPDLAKDQSSERLKSASFAHQRASDASAINALDALIEQSAAPKSLLKKK